MSDDILSGGAIDQSTSGPIPPSDDGRALDILSEQKERQDQDAIGGTQFAPRVEPLPPVPEALEVAPQFPFVPSFDFGISGSALEEMREISRQTTVDVLKNVTINGQGPSFEGSAISFNVQQEPPANEAFFFQGIVVQQPLPQIQPTQPPAIEQPRQQDQREQGIQDVVVAPPSRQQRTPTTEEPQQIQETKISPQPTQVTTEATQSQDQTQQSETPKTQRQEPTKAQPQEQLTTEEKAIVDRIVSRIDSTVQENEPITRSDIRKALKEEGLQATQSSWSNYVDPQEVRDAIEKRREEKKAVAQKIESTLKETAGKDIEKIKDYYSGNTPFPPLIRFTVCFNGTAQDFLVPAFGPYQN